jgi:hypothetical protein
VPSDITSILLGGFAGAVATAIGWFVTDYQRRTEARRNRRIDFIQREIFELFAPLNVLAQREYAYRILRDKLNANGLHDAGWKCTIDLIVPAQKAIYNLLQDKAYLLGDGEKCESFKAALDHCNSALGLFDLGSKVSDNLSVVQATPMPNDFKEDVEQILQRLQSDLDRLIGLGDSGSSIR